MTLIEAVVVILVIGFFVAMILPTLNQHSGCSQRISCVNNLKQLGLAYKIWSGDGGDRYPMAVSVTNGGAMEYMDTADAWKTFQVMSNELSTPRVLLCPKDKEHSRATNFDSSFTAKNISYFAGLDARDDAPNLILAGDNNLEHSGRPIT
ncbi:MAG: hypothetical protein RL616_2694, partial [Verrucomicrobiota bacterium]